MIGQRCPEHGIPDCSPLLNGCSWQPPTPPDPQIPAGTVCGTFGCDQPATVRVQRPHEWFPGYYCATDGADGKPV